MEIRDLKMLLVLMQDYGLVELEVEDKKGKVRLVRGNLESGGAQAAPKTVKVTGPIVSPQSPQSRPRPEAATRPRPGAAEVPALEANQKLVTSPMVGTFYRAAGPNSDPLVEEGDSVRKGQSLCIIEAMKMMNEIEAEAAGRIVKILCGNAQPVEYGQPLMVLEIA
ncbi:MAG: acetyl-CoA carboxylase biotin carboxyl carrier protein [Candidatus Binataceae bacterium]|nr:acetyl-CoA carboxylase biotin carboxyl carrier protein [Candidatus Binataceae bacterium]